MRNPDREIAFPDRGRAKPCLRDPRISLYAIAGPLPGCLAYVRENHNGRWVNDPEQWSVKVLEIYRPEGVNGGEKSQCHHWKYPGHADHGETMVPA